MKLSERLLKPLFYLQNNLPSKTLNLPMMTITGVREVTIEQHEKLLSFSETSLLLQWQSGTIQIIGQSFMIKVMYPHEIILEGNIEEIKFHPT